MKICVIIPACNESQFIGPVIDALREKVLDVVVIDDGSSDATSAIAKGKGARVIRHTQKKGKGYSLREGFEYAVHHDYDGVVTMDGDGQHDAGDIGRFLEAAQQHAISIIAGNRMQDSKGMPFVRYCTNRFMSWLISLACRQSIADTQCGYRYIHCEILRQIRLECDDFEIETEILMKACKKRFKVYSVPVETIYSDEKSMINPFKDTVRFFAYFTKELFSSRRNSN